MSDRPVLAICAGKDGGAPGDRFLTDPRRCRFDAATLPVCKSENATDDCLTPMELSTVRRLHAGPVMQGDPASWPDQQFYLFKWSLGPAFVPSKFDFDRDLDRVDARLAGTLNSNSSDLSRFSRRGGKLLIYTGLADPAVPFHEVVNYYDRVVATAGGSEVAARFARLFLIPGMGHCFGGPGVTEIGQPFTSSVPKDVEGDALMTLVAWTEGGQPPAMLLARKEAGDGSPAQQRPVCAYPALPEYRGGKENADGNFACTVRPNGAEQLPAPRYLN